MAQVPLRLAFSVFLSVHEHFGLLEARFAGLALQFGHRQVDTENKQCKPLDVTQLWFA